MTPGNINDKPVTCVPFPEDATKTKIIAWIINKLTWENRQKDKEIRWWKKFAITGTFSQMVFWLTLFVYGKVYAGWFPL